MRRNYDEMGLQDKAEEMISRLREIAKTQYIATARACIYGALSDKARAFDELNKAFAARDWELYRLNVDPYWRPVTAQAFRTGEPQSRETQV